MTDNPKRILAFVPNGASTDNRVVREAESLKAAGHEVLLVGLRLTNLPGRRAISPNGVNIARVDWQYRAFSKIAQVYVLILLPLALALLAALGLLSVFVYFRILLPIADAVFNTLSAFALQILQFSTSLFGWDVLEHMVPPTLTALRSSSPVGYHLLSIAVIYGLYRILRRPLRRIKTSRTTSSVERLSRPFLHVLLQRVRYARRYGESENVQSFTLLERVLGADNALVKRVHEAVSSRFVSQAREKAFLEIGREFKPDLIQCHEIGPLPAAIALKQELGCKVIYEAHEIYDDLANASQSMSKRHQHIHETYLSQTDAFITVNEHIGAYYNNTYPDMPPAVILPNSVYPKKVKYDGRLHRAAKLPDGAKILLYQGGFSPHRGMHILMEAAYELPENWYVVFMGKGPLEEALRAQSEELAQKAREAFRGEIKDVSMDFSNLERLEVTTPNVASNGQGEGEHSSMTAENFITLESLRAVGEGSSKVSSKSVNKLVDAIRSLRDGEARLSAEEKLRAEEAKVSRNGELVKARFVPIAPHAELVEWTSGGTIGVIPYENVGLNHWNCSPNKIWEYPNAGIPILASRLSYLTEMINKWNIGWTIPSDPKAVDIVSAIRAIEANSDLDEKRQACAEFIQQDNYPIHEKRLFELVDSL